MLTTSEYPAFSSQPAAWHARGTFKPVDSKKKSARRNQCVKTSRAISSAIRAQRATRFRYPCIAASHRHAHDKTRITRHNSTFITKYMAAPEQRHQISSSVSPPRTLLLLVRVVVRTQAPARRVEAAIAIATTGATPYRPSGRGGALGAAAKQTQIRSCPRHTWADLLPIWHPMTSFAALSGNFSAI